MRRQPHLPLRRCVICGKRDSKRGLVRLVRTPAGVVEVDLTGKQAGRGAYVCWGTGCWDEVLKRPARLERALRIAISPDEREHLARSMQTVVKE